MKKAFLLFVLSFLLVNIASAQKIITGRVIDSLSRQPVPGVYISTIDGKNATITDAMGSFELKTNANKLKASAIGYKTKFFSTNKNNNTIILSKANVNLKQVTVRANAISPAQTVCKLDLRLKPVNTSQEVLRLIPGLFIAQHEGGGKAEQIFLRGFDMDHGTDISINVDGMPVNMVSHAHGQGYADLHFLIPETIDHIEFEKGTYNPQYGDFQTGGYINFHTKNYLQHNRIQLEAGMFNTVRMLTMFNLFGSRDTKQSAYIASEYMLTDGFFDMSQNFYRLNTFIKYRNFLSNKTLMTLEASVFRTRWDAAGLIPQRAVQEGIIDRYGTLDSCGGGQTHRNNLILSFYTRTADNASLKNEFYFSDYAFDLHSNFTFFLKDSINGDQIRQREKRRLYGYHLLYSQRNTVGKWHLISKLGAELRYDDIDNIELSHTKNRYQLLNRIELGDIDETNINAFAQEIMQKDSWVIRLGARLDFFDFVYQNKLSKDYKTIGVKKSILLPKLSIIYSLSPNVQIYLKAGKGFHSNDARVIAKTRRDILPAAYGSDLGVIFKPWDKALVNLALWGLYLQQEFVFSGDEGTVEPCGRTLRRGVDMSARVQILSSLYAKLDVNYAIPRSLDATEGGIYLPLAPIWSSVGGLYYRSHSGLVASISYRYLGKRPADEFYNMATKPYTVFDAALSYTREKYELGLSIENLFNTPWYDAQFETTSRLRGESKPVTDIDFTPGTPFDLKARVAIFFGGK